MRIYIFTILLIGFWSCEDEQDTTPPEVSISYPPNNFTITDSITITGTASDNNSVEFVELLINGFKSNLIDDSEPYTFNWVTWDSTNGDYSIVLRAHDESNNTSDSDVSFVNVNNTYSGNVIGSINGVGSTNQPPTITFHVVLLNDTRNIISNVKFRLRYSNYCNNNTLNYYEFPSGLDSLGNIRYSEIEGQINSGEEKQKPVTVYPACWSYDTVEVIDIIWD